MKRLLTPAVILSVFLLDRLAKAWALKHLVWSSLQVLPFMPDKLAVNARPLALSSGTRRLGENEKLFVVMTCAAANIVQQEKIIPNAANFAVLEIIFSC